MGWLGDFYKEVSDIGNRYVGLPTSSDNDQTNTTNALNAQSLKDTEANNAAQLQLSQQNMQLEQDFAQNGISWRIADAAKNGISPLAALGSTEPSYSPVAAVLQGDSFQAPPTPNQNMPAANLINSMGQDATRAILATKDPDTRAASALNLIRQQKENDLLDVQVKQAQLNLAHSASPGIRLGYTDSLNADGTKSRIPTYNTHNTFLGPLQWSLENRLLPEMGFDSGTQNRIQADWVSGDSPSL